MFHWEIQSIKRIKKVNVKFTLKVYSAIVQKLVSVFHEWERTIIHTHFPFVNGIPAFTNLPHIICYTNWRYHSCKLAIWGSIAAV